MEIAYNQGNEAAVSFIDEYLSKISQKTIEIGY